MNMLKYKLELFVYIFLLILKKLKNKYIWDIFWWFGIEGFVIICYNV